MADNANLRNFVAVLDWLADRYGIRHIRVRISAYNSRANGIVERQHRTIRESIVKACEGNIAKWPAIAAPHAFWTDRATTRKLTGRTPFYMAHGLEPILPFDITPRHLSCSQYRHHTLHCQPPRHPLAPAPKTRSRPCHHSHQRPQQPL